MSRVLYRQYFKLPHGAASIFVRRKAILADYEILKLSNSFVYYSRKMIFEKFGIKTFTLKRGMLKLVFIDESSRNLFMMKYG